MGKEKLGEDRVVLPTAVFEEYGTAQAYVESLRSQLEAANANYRAQVLECQRLTKILEEEEPDISALMKQIADLTARLAAAEAREMKLRDLAIWMTGAYPFADHEYFVQNRYLLTLPHDTTALREFGLAVAKKRDEESAKGYMDAAYQVPDEAIVDEIIGGGE